MLEEKEILDIFDDSKPESIIAGEIKKKDKDNMIAIKISHQIEGEFLFLYQYY